MEGRSPTRRLRQHHAVEHATMSVLSQILPSAHMVARSDLQGFIVYGDVQTEILQQAAEQGLQRLQSGEGTLAVHPNCGTNLVAAGMLSGLAALMAGGTGRNRSVFERLPSAILGATIGLIFAQPFGRWLQTNVTTTNDVAGLHLASIVRMKGPMTRHRVTFA